MRFTLQEKLALAITSAGSQRALADQLGISHQRVGRWLREGQPLPPDENGNLRLKKDGTPRTYGKIPSDVFAQEAINTVFAEHKKKARAVAKKQDIPFPAEVPLYMERRPLRSGELGDRVFVEHTEYLDERLRTLWIVDAQSTQDFYKVNIRSMVDLYRYATLKAAEDHETDPKFKSNRYYRKEVIRIIADSFARRNRIEDTKRAYPLYTQSVYIGPRSHFEEVLQGVNDQLMSKHSPASVGPGTKFANEFLLQLLPQRLHDYHNHPPSIARRASKKPTRKKGPARKR